MKSKKLWLLLLLTSMAITMLYGCGSKNSSESANEAANETATSESEDQGSGNEEITLTMMYSGTQATEGEDFEIDVLPRLVKEKFPNINLEVTKLPDDQYYTALKTKLATGEAPDFILAQPRYAGANSVYGLAKAGYLLDISDLEAISLAGVGAEDFTYEGKTYAVPSGVTFLATYYNKDMFDENELEIPTNWDEFVNVCETLKAAGITPIVMGDKDSYVMQFGLYQLAANKVYPKNSIFDNQLSDGTTKFTDGEWEEVLDMYYSLYEKGYIMENSLGLGAAQAIQKFIDGEAAMTFDGTFNATALTSIGAAGEFERGFFALPGNAPGEDLYTAGASGAGPSIYSGTKYPEECKAILEYWFDGESDLFDAYANTGKVIVTYGDTETNPLFVSCMDLYRAGKSFYWCNQGWPAGTETEMQAKFSELIGGQGITTSEIAEAMQLKFEELYTE